MRMLFALLVLTMVCYSCKKEEKPLTSTNTIEFDLDGKHYKRSLLQAELMVDSMGDETKYLSLLVATDSFIFQLIINDQETNPADDCMKTADYVELESDCEDCNNFQAIMVYINSDLYISTPDPNSVLTVSSCTGAKPVINGSFAFTVIDDNNSASVPFHTITNGRLNNVSYTRK